MVPRVTIADDHPVVRLGLRFLLEAEGRYRVIAEAVDAEDLMRALHQELPDLLLTDMIMPTGSMPDGHAMLALLRRSFPQLPVVLITMSSNLPSLRLALRSGVRAIIDKTAPADHIPAVLAQVLAGATYLSPNLEGVLRDADCSYPDPATLSRRELEVLRLCVSGPSITEVAEQLGRTVSTVSRQRRAAMEKLGIRTDVELFAYAHEQGLGSLPLRTRNGSK
ncbi:response regulator transcription factor [Stenotrophomonas sp.]|uniref:response regulator transcription factor n=1 Tax=Stenotrophomonas sp. TaxID=69392 RepID=UPI0028AFF537|nr:response regulator transcription factor [Stenotrophomonas sp.]